jgi:hypothetical protein
MNRELRAVLLSAAIFLLAAGDVAAQQAPYSRQNPPPVSFIFAGPVAMADKQGTSVRLNYRLAIFSMQPSHVEIVDADSGKILVDDPAPALKPSALKHPVDPSIPIFEWEGKSAAETITDTSPAWIHDKNDTHVHLEARVVSVGRADFTITQSATYSAAAKAAIIQAAAYNSKLKADSH